MSPGDYQSLSGNFLQLFAAIVVTNGRAARYVTVRVGFFEYLLDTRDRCRLLSAECRREPPLHHSRCNRLHSALFYGFDSRLPAFFSSNLCTCVGEHQFHQTVWSVDSEPHANHSAHRKPAKMRAANVQLIQQAEHVL